MRNLRDMRAGSTGPDYPPSPRALGAAMRRTEVLDRVTEAMRGEVLAFRMLPALLQAAAEATEAAGAALVTAEPDGPTVLHATGTVPATALVLAAGTAGRDAPACEGTVLAVPVPDRLGLRAALVLWRHAGSWQGDDPALASAIACPLRMLLEQERLLGEVARHGRTDPLTGLLNRRAFADELERHLARVQGPDGRGVLIALDLDGLRHVNDGHGPEAGDDVLVAVAGLLRTTFRPTDVLGRRAGDEFAVWLDGADELTAAERADELQGAVPSLTAALLPGGTGGLTASIGIAPLAIDPVSADGADLDDMLFRARSGVTAAKGAGGDGWQVVPAAAP